LSSRVSGNVYDPVPGGSPGRQPFIPGDRPVRVGMVGSGFIAQQHSAAYLLLSNLLGETVPRVGLLRIAGGRRVHQVGPRYGWAETSDDWRSVTETDDIDVVDVVTPNDSHGYLTRSAAAAGKHLICEKPLAPDLATAEQMATDVEAAGVRAAVCFIYVPERRGTRPHARPVSLDGRADGQRKPWPTSTVTRLLATRQPSSFAALEVALQALPNCCSMPSQFVYPGYGSGSLPIAKAWSDA
jgi:hypothetical protein